MIEKKLAIVIPTKNEQNFLPHLLESIQKQTYKDFIIIIADAQSSDKTKKIAIENDCILVDGGLPYAGRNNGAEKAIELGVDLIIFIDADIILPNDYFLEKTIDEFYSRNLDIAGTLQIPYNIDDDGFRISKSINYRLLYGIANVVMSALENSSRPMFQVCMFVKPHVHQKIGGFKNLEYGEDSKYSLDAKTLGFTFGIVRSGGKVFISPRRYKDKGFIKSGAPYFFISYVFGRHYVQGESKKKYFDE